MEILGCVHICFIHRCCTHNDQERETSSHQQSPYWNTGCLIYFFEFLPLRQKERFVPEAHLHVNKCPGTRILGNMTYL
jgi:hypothetical protein